ncbi:MAG: DNA polymerase III subunit beta [Candidatus Parcubacteria bacterium]|nr:MAG: DNA polymerase III subunit beta [Candidatus Parcubacteria bacterium]
MKLSVLKQSLLDKLLIINRITPKKSDLNILNFFKIYTKNKKIFLVSTDLEISYQATIIGNIKEDGEFLIPAKQFLEIINNFYEDEVNLETKENNLIIRGNNIFCSLVSISEEEFPLLPEFSNNEYIEIDSILFEKILEKIINPIKTANLIKPEFAGVYFWLDNNYLKLVSTDSIRLSEFKLKKDIILTNIKKEIKILIPFKIIDEFLKIRKKPIKTKIYIEENQITLDLEDQVLISKLLTIDYPDYQQIIPQDFNLEIIVNKDEILKVIKLNNVFMDKTKELKIKFNIQEKSIDFYTKNELIGENINKVFFDINYINIDDNFEMSFNLDFLLDGIKSIDSEKIFLGINLPSDINIKPILIKSPLEDDFIYILMPF